MRDTINQEDIDFYQEYGFVRIRSLLTPEEVKRLRVLQLNAVEQRGGYRFPDRDILSEDLPEIDRMFIQRLNLWRDYEPIREFTLSSKIGKIAAELSKVDAMRVWHDSCFIKEGWANATSWHFDAAYWSFDTRQGATAWVALSDSRAENGGLYFMPGSHREIEFDLPAFDKTSVGGLFDLPKYQKWRNQEAISLPLEAGDCTFHNGLTLHASGINMTPHRREAWVCVYMPDGSIFNGKPGIFSADYLKSLKYNDYLSNDELNPVVYRKGQ